MRCFNEAAGIHRRKRGLDGGAADCAVQASMRPPEFTGGNELADPINRRAVIRLQ